MIELRRAEGGIRAWAAEPGEYYHQLDGSMGGLWRRNGRPPQMLCGVGFSGQGKFEGTHYRRLPGADDPRVAWIMDGVDEARSSAISACRAAARRGSSWTAPTRCSARRRTPSSWPARERHQDRIS